MSYTLDQTTDVSFRELHTFLDGITTPAFVKQAEIDTIESVSKLSEEAFADRYNHAFPIHTPSATYLSNVHFVQKQAELKAKWGVGYVEEVADRLKVAGELHKISEDLAGYAASLLVKHAHAPAERSVFTTKIAGVDTELFIFKTKEDLAKQAADFSNQIINYPFDWRKDIAVGFWKAAEELGLDELPELVCKYAGMYFPDTSIFKDELSRRMKKLALDKQESYLPVIEKIAQASSAEDYYKLCAEAYAVEKAAGALDSLSIRNVLGDIIDTTHTLSVEKVAELLNVIDMAGEPYRVADLQKVSKEVYKEAFGADFDPANVNQLQDVLPTMPVSDVALFRELSGVNPL